MTRQEIKGHINKSCENYVFRKLMEGRGDMAPITYREEFKIIMDMDADLKDSLEEHNLSAQVSAQEIEECLREGMTRGMGRFRDEKFGEGRLR